MIIMIGVNIINHFDDDRNYATMNITVLFLIQLQLLRLLPSSR